MAKHQLCEDTCNFICRSTNKQKNCIKGCEIDCDRSVEFGEATGMIGSGIIALGIFALWFSLSKRQKYF